MNNQLDEEENFIEETLLKLEQMESDYQFLKDRIGNKNLPNPESMTSALVCNVEALKRIVATSSQYSSIIATLEAEIPIQPLIMSSTEVSLSTEYEKVCSVASLETLKNFF